MPPEYCLRKATRADYPILRRWLVRLPVAGIWARPDKEKALVEAEADIGDCKVQIVEVGTRLSERPK